MHTSMRSYLSEFEVELMPVDAKGSARPQVGIPVPEGWVTAGGDAFPKAHTVIVAPGHEEDGWTPNAVLFHSRLSRWRPSGELLEVAVADVAGLPRWRVVHASSADYLGYQSRLACGTFCMAEMEFSVATRYLIVDHEYDRDLVQLAVTTRADPGLPLDLDVGTILGGLTVEG